MKVPKKYENLPPTEEQILYLNGLGCMERPKTLKEYWVARDYWEDKNK